MAKGVVEWKRDGEGIIVCRTPLGEYYIGPEGVFLYRWAVNLPEGSQTTRPGDTTEELSKPVSEEEAKELCRQHFRREVANLYVWSRLQ